MSDIVVFGSFVVDLMARSAHIPVPGETIKSSLFRMGAGGKGSNQAVACKLSGGDVSVVTKVGRDAFAQVLYDQYEKIGLSAEHVFVSSQAQTGNALILVDEGTSQNAITVTPGACETFTRDDVEQIKPLLASAKILLAQLEVNQDANELVVDYAKGQGARVVLNPAPIHAVSSEFLCKADVITPNEVEASALSGIPIKTPDDALRAARILMDKGVKSVVITLGKQGVLAVTENQSRLFRNYDVKVVDSTGAGDAFNGGLVTALSEGKNLLEACAFANVVSNLAVPRMGTAPSMPTRREIDAFLEAHPSAAD